MQHLMSDTPFDSSYDHRPGECLLLEELQDERYILSLDSQDLEATAEHVAGGLQYLGIKPEDITGALVWEQDGSFREVWVTEASAPFALSASYMLVH